MPFLEVQNSRKKLRQRIEENCIEHNINDIQINHMNNSTEELFETNIPYNKIYTSIKWEKKFLPILLFSTISPHRYIYIYIYDVHSIKLPDNN